MLVVDGVEGGEDGGLFFGEGGDVGDGVGVEGWKVLICFCGLGHCEGVCLLVVLLGLGGFSIYITWGWDALSGCLDYL